MRQLLPAGYFARNLRPGAGEKHQLRGAKFVHPVSHHDRVLAELRKLGVPPWIMLRMESRYMPYVIHPDEHIGGVVYGHHKDGFAMIAATDRRVVFLDRKPLFTHEDEIDYRVVSGVTHEFSRIGCTMTLHTKMKDYTLRTFNRRCMQGFVKYIETRTLEHEQNKESWR